MKRFMSMLATNRLILAAFVALIGCVGNAAYAASADYTAIAGYAGEVSDLWDIVKPIIVGFVLFSVLIGVLLKVRSKTA